MAFANNSLERDWLYLAGFKFLLYAKSVGVNSGFRKTSPAPLFNRYLIEIMILDRTISVNESK